MKKFLKVFLAAVICLVFIVALCVGGFFIFYTPSLTADMSVKTGDVTTGASGYLYGIAEEGVPSKNMTESIDLSTASQKVAGGSSQDVYCRNTYSWDTYKTVTCYVQLKAGNNKIVFTNSGNNKFDNRDTHIPHIASFTVSEICG